MSISKLNQLRLQSFTISKSSYTLEFSGKIKDKPVTYFASTSYNLSTNKENKSDALEKSSEIIWPVLEQTLLRTELEENQIHFIFKNERILTFWQKENATDNLIIVRKKNSDEWFTVL